MSCTAIDASNNSEVCGFDVVVLGPSQQIVALISLVQTFNLQMRRAARRQSDAPSEGLWLKISAERFLKDRPSHYVLIAETSTITVEYEQSS